MISFKRLKTSLTRNWGLKLLSFVLALILWFALIPEEKTFQERTMSVRLEVHNIPAGMELVESPPLDVSVTIRAPNRLLPQINSNSVYAVLDLQRATVAQRQFPLNRNNVYRPEGAEIKEIYPSQVNLRLERTEQVLLKVTPEIVGEPPEGYKLTKVEVVPEEVTVAGPESKVRDDMKVKTAPVDISQFTQSTEVEANLIPPIGDVRFAGPEPVVRIRLLIEKIGGEDETSAASTPVKKKTPAKKTPATQ